MEAGRRGVDAAACGKIIRSFSPTRCPSPWCIKTSLRYRLNPVHPSFHQLHLPPVGACSLTS